MIYVLNTEKYFAVKIIERMMDYIVYKFAQSVANDKDHSQSSFQNNLDNAINRITDFLKKTAKKLNKLVITEGKKRQKKQGGDSDKKEKITIQGEIQASRKDRFRIGEKKKCKSNYFIYY